MHGAALLYNLMLADRRGDPELIDGYLEALSSWAGLISERRLQLGALDRSDFWRTVLEVNPRVPASSQGFVNSWIDLVLGAGDPSELRHSKAARTLIEEREIRLKGMRRARLVEPRALELWSGAAGTNRLTYRWRVVQWIVRDIADGQTPQTSPASYPGQRYTAPSRASSSPGARRAADHASAPEESEIQLGTASRGPRYESR